MKPNYKLSYKFYIGLFIVSMMTLLGIISFFYTPYDPNAMDIIYKLAPPSKAHLLGTDQFGRDILSRLMIGAGLVMLVGFCCVLISLFFGGILGALAGYYGGIFDDVLMKLVETQMAFPGVLLALMIISIFSPSLANIILAISLMTIPRFTRIIRSGYIQYKDADFVLAARALGACDLGIMLRHILPNIMPSIVVTSALSFATAIMSEAGLSYLGLGINPPFASWGKMLNEAQLYMLTAPLMALVPGIMITLIVLAFNLIADDYAKAYQEQGA